MKTSIKQKGLWLAIFFIVLFAIYKTQFGYHLIKLNAKNEEKPYAFEEIKSQIGDMVMKDKQQKAYQSKINQLKILYPVDQM